VRVVRRDFVVRVVRRVESVCCAFTVDTPPKVRAIARPIAQLLENPIRIFSSHYAALRVQAPAGDLAGGASEPVGDLPARLVKVFALIEMYRDSTNMPTMLPQLKLNPPPAFQPQRPFESPNVVLSSGAFGLVKF